MKGPCFVGASEGSSAESEILMRIVCISDTHERHDEIALPAGDVLLCAGDITAHGNLVSLQRFAKWMNRQPHRYKVLVAGNHDFCFQERAADARTLMREVAPDVRYLEDESLRIDGVSVWGSPWQPRFYDWAFNLDRGKPLAEKWALIPEDTDILVTHGPPFGTLDLTPNGMRVGCEALAERLTTLNVRLHVFGHIHHSYGVIERGGTISVNAAICDEQYRAAHEPIVVDL
jgi:Icc-related predicted phosphoesterase